MARLNTKAVGPKAFTHEGAPAYPHLSAIHQLRRSVLSCLLWEGEFYEGGASIANRIVKAAEQVSPEALAELAIEAREDMNLRHVPLLLLEVLTRTAAGRDDKLVSRTVARVIQRADEIPEFLAVYFGGKHDRKTCVAGHGRTLSKQAREGLRGAFAKFGEYQFAKYNRDNAIKLRDVLRIIHPKPQDTDRAGLYQRIRDNTLVTPDTWEVALSGGADKRATFERLIREHKLGYFALLRNLRNMVKAGVDQALVEEAIIARKGGAERILPFRYIAAARAAPQFEPALDKALIAAIGELPVLPGRTVVLVDVSGSMDCALSDKSDLRRIDAAAALASIIPAESLRVFSFSDRTVEVPPRKGMSGVNAVIRSQGHSGTDLGSAVELVNKTVPHDRLIVVTDEQSHTQVPESVAKRAYMINVASYQNGVGYGKNWTHIDGFSESVFRYIVESEC